jgi:hypothetical protein
MEVNRGKTYERADATGAIHHVIGVLLVEGLALDGEGDGAAVAAAVVHLAVLHLGGRLRAGVLRRLVRRPPPATVEAEWGR